MWRQPAAIDLFQHLAPLPLITDHIIAQLSVYISHLVLVYFSAAGTTALLSLQQLSLHLPRPRSTVTRPELVSGRPEHMARHTAGIQQQQRLRGPSMCVRSPFKTGEVHSSRTRLERMVWSGKGFTIVTAVLLRRAVVLLSLSICLDRDQHLRGPSVCSVVRSKWQGTQQQQRLRGPNVIHSSSRSKLSALSEYCASKKTQNT